MVTPTQKTPSSTQPPSTPGVQKEVQSSFQFPGKKEAASFIINFFALNSFQKQEAQQQPEKKSKAELEESHFLTDPYWYERHGNQAGNQNLPKSAQLNATQESASAEKPKTFNVINPGPQKQDPQK